MTQTNFILNEQHDDVRARVGEPEMPLENGIILGGGGGGGRMIHTRVFFGVQNWNF